MSKLNIKALGLTFGIIWSLSIFVMGITAMFGYAGPFVVLFSSVYIGYKATILGSIIGAIWGFVDGGVFGLLVGWLYNKLSN